MLRLSNIEKVYKTGASNTYVLRNINCDIRRGEFVTIMGPSGAGKSTLLGILGMLESEWTGQYHFLDLPVHEMKQRERNDLNRQHIGFVFQQYHLLDNLTVAENLDVPLSYRGMKRSEREGLVAEMLDRFSLVGRKDLYPSQLSGGQQQVVGVARAVIGNPTLLLADEPTGNLHSDQGREVMELFRKLNKEGMTIVQVTHSDMNASYSDRVINLMDGWMISPATGGESAPRKVAMW